MKVIVTGGAGFIGSNLVRLLLERGHEVLNIDALTYAGNIHSLDGLADSPAYRFLHADVRDSSLMSRTLREYGPDWVMHLAAESHVDRSIDDPGNFMTTNVMGTFSLLQAALEYYRSLEGEKKERFRFHHISTDEVYGSLHDDSLFLETTPYDPQSPYSASKAASDHLVRAWHHTYGLPVLTTNCSNNYGPLHFPEKLIPLMIVNALAGKSLPVYGDGMQIRDWLYVRDHCRAIACVLEGGRLGETYNIGGWNEKPNIEIVHTICTLLDELRPRADGQSYRTQITYVQDRPGHDRRYAIDARKIERELGWRPVETFETGIRKTVQWYLDHPEWVAQVQSGSYRDWLVQQYGGQA